MSQRARAQKGGESLHEGGGEEREREIEDSRGRSVPAEEKERFKPGGGEDPPSGSSSLSTAAGAAEGAQEEKRAGLGKAQEVLKKR